MNVRRIDTWDGIGIEVGHIIADYNQNIALINNTPEIIDKVLARRPELYRYKDRMLALIQEVISSEDNIKHLLKSRRMDYYNSQTADRLLRLSTGDKTAVVDE